MLTYTDCLILAALTEPTKTLVLRKKLNNSVTRAGMVKRLKMMARNEWVKIHIHPYGQRGQPRIYYVFERTEDGHEILLETLYAYQKLLNGATQ